MTFVSVDQIDLLERYLPGIMLINKKVAVPSGERAINAVAAGLDDEVGSCGRGGIRSGEYFNVADQMTGASRWDLRESSAGAQPRDPILESAAVVEFGADLAPGVIGPTEWYPVDAFATEKFEPELEIAVIQYARFALDETFAFPLDLTRSRNSRVVPDPIERC